MSRLILALLLCSLAPHAGAAPNIVLILTDDQGYGDAGVHGNRQIRTPHIDRFAEEGVAFERFYVSPVCAPTRAALLTGRYYYRSGVIHTSRGGAKMHGDEVTLAQLLGGAGYRTGIFGKWHLGDNYPMRPIDQGFDEALWHKSGGIGQAPDQPNDYFDPWLWRGGEKVRGKGYCTDIFFDAALEFIERGPDEPFFVYLPTNAPHTPLTVAERYWKPYAGAGLDETTAKVYGMVENLDENLGRLLAGLDRLGQRENTVVVFLSDNGPQQERYNAGLRGRKGSTYEGGVRALSFWQWPGRFAGGVRLAAPAADIDVVPTLLALADIRPAAGTSFDGVDLAPLLEGETESLAERLLFLQCHRGLQPQRYQNAAVIGSRWKLVVGGGTFTREDWKPGPRPPLELFDLDADPGERRNLAGGQPELAAELRESYERWFADVAATRDFQPGVIRLGSPREDPAVLCRYQDAAYIDGEPAGWDVFFEREGGYELTIERKGTAAAVLHVEVNGLRSSQRLAEGESAGVFEFPSGPARLDVWVQEEGRPREIVVDNSTLGDVKVRYADGE